MKTEIKNRKFIPKTKQLISKLKKYYKLYAQVKAELAHSIGKIEEDMRKEMKCDELAFIYNESGQVVGVGTPKSKMLKFISSEELEKNEEM